MGFEFLDHTADIAVRLRAPDFGGLLRVATHALRDILLDPASRLAVDPVDSLGIRLEAEDCEALLVDYLNEMVYLFDTRRFLPVELEVTCVEIPEPPKLGRLEATLRGETFDPARHILRTEIKAATFHAIEIEKTPDGLEVDVIFDI